MKDSFVHIFSTGSATLINDSKQNKSRLGFAVIILLSFIAPLLVHAQHLDNRKRLDSFQRARSTSGATILKILANSYNVTGGGAYCSGGSGVAVGLAGSQLDTVYQLQLNGVNIGSPVLGDGNAISFGLQTAAGTYTVFANTDNGPIAMNGQAIVVINPLPTPTAGSNTPQCVGSTLNLNASGGSTYNWTGPNGFTSNAQNPSISNVATAASGTYTVTVTDGNGCTNIATATVTVNALPTVTCPANSSVCISAASFALTGATPAGGTYSGTGVSGGNFNPATAGVGQHTITYTYTDGNGCTNNCTFDITVITATTTANAGPDQTGAATCGLTSVTLAANTPTAGTGSWSIVSGTGGTITTPSDPASTFTGTAGTSYTLRWTITNPPCSASTDDVTITFNQNPTVATAGSDQTVCATTATLAGNTGTVGTGTWTLISGAGTITTPGSPTSGITGLGVGANTFRWTISNAPCTATFDEVVITRVAATTTANAGPDQTGAATCGLTSVTLAANTPTAGTGSWSIISGTGGTITTPSDPTSTFTGTAGTTYTLRWTITNPPCASSTDDVVITFNQNPTTANAGPDQTDAATCGLTSVTLAANTPAVGTGSWSIVSGTGGTITTPTSATSTFTGTAGTTYTLRWTITSSPCTSSTDDVVITFNQNPTIANAGADQTVCATTATLAGNTATVGTGTWTLVSGAGTITTPGSPTSGITGLGVGANTFRWTISNAPCTATFDEVVITRVAATTTANAGPDQTGAATCGLTSVTLAANTPTGGIGSWSIVSGTGGTITTPSDPASTFTGTAGTTYTLRWTITNPPCAASTDDVIITFNQNPTTANAGSDQTLCATTATLAGNAPTVGTGAWTLISGTGSITTPGSPTSGITGLGVGANTFRWTISNAPCTATFDDVVITRVAATTTANAGPDQTGAATCGLTSVTLAANTPTAGTGSWSIVSGAGGTITTPSSPTSTFTGTAGTSYTLRWTITNPPCATSTDDVIITFNQIPTTANAGPDQTDATTCGLTSVTLAANTPAVGTGSWSIVSGAGGTITTPSSPTSTFTGTAGMTYTLRWAITSSPCTASTDDVVITFNRNPTIATAGSDQTVCATTATLAGNTATVGTGTWTLVSGAGTITTPGSPTSGITGLGVGANTFRWTISNAPCTATFDEVVITRVATTTTANAGPDQTGAATCGLTSVTLAANTPTAGTGSWSIVSGTGGTITTPSDPASTFTGTAGTTYTLRWTITNPPCAASTDDVIITFNQNPTTANAGSDQTLCATTATLAGNAGTVGTGAWTLISGTGSITTPGSPTSGITGLGVGANTFRWTISNAPCTATFDDVVITRVAATTTANAGPDQTGAATCGLTSVTLAANTPTAGTGSWSIVSGAGGTITTPSSPTSTFTGTAGTSYTLRWTITNPPCAVSTDDVAITFNQIPTTANAGPDQTGAATCGLTTVTLAANTPTAGTGSWSVVSGTGGTITTPSNPTSTFTGTAGTTYTLRWTITSSPCTSSTDDVIVTFNRNPTTANAGSDQTLCAATATLAGNAATVGTGTWTLVSGAGTITTPGSPTSGITALGVGANTFRWTISNAPCTATFDEVVITRVAATTTANAGPDQTGAATCGLTSVTLAANTPTGGIGSWSIVSGTGGTITTPSDPASTFTGTAGTTYTLRWTITNPPCAVSTDDVVITFNRIPTTATAGSDQTVCATTATLAGNAATVGTGAWTLISGTGSITTPGSPTSGITGLGVGANTFRWTISNAPCTATFDEVVITRVAATTTAAAGPDQTGAATCGLTSVTLAANTPTAGTGSWTIVSGTGGTITTPTSPTSTFTGTPGTSYTLRWTITNPPCATSTDDVIITFNQNPTTANAGTAQSVCAGGNITLAANAAAVGTGLWSIVSGPSTSTAQFSSTTNPTATFTPAGGAGSYVLRWTISNAPCTASTSNVTITVNALPAIPTISAGGATTFCQGGNVTLTSSSATGNQWSLNGTAISGATNQTYSATASGSYTVTVTNGNGCSRTSTATSITVNSSPTITVSPAAPSAFCSGGSVTLTASGANTYTWSPTEGLSITTGSTVIATPEATTTYTVTGTGANGCTNTATVTVTVTPSPDGDITSSPPVCSGNNSGTITLSNYTGTIVRWESSTNGGASWTTINNTSTTQSYSNLTQTTIYRVLLTLNNGCDDYSDVGIIPVNEPFTPTVTVNPAIICEGQSATLSASGYGAPPFPLEDFGNANPAGWSGNDANNNNEDEDTDWGETGDGKVRSGKVYNSQAPPTNTKFMIVAGTTDGADQTAALITPPFSLVGVVNPIFGFMTALDFNAGTVGKVEISIDGGATYITLETFTGPAKVGDGDNGFVQRNYNLSAYIGQPNVRVRFNYFGTTGSIWAVDNVGLQGTFEPVTYQWSPLNYMTPAAGNTQTVTVTPPAGTHPYCVVATTGAGCASQSVCKDVIVKPLPTCSITGNNPVCPGSTNTYSAPATAGYTYQWTISGGATISGSATGQTVTVVANNTCGTYTLTLVTTLNGCASAPCTQIVNIVDNTAPVATAPATQSFQCLANVPAPGTLTATDNCSGNITATGVDVRVASGCGYTITRTWTFTDACNNTSSVSQIINVLDNTAPVAPAAPASQNFQCLALVPAPGTLTATDNCSGNITATGVDVQVAKACGYTITRTWTFTDSCNNTSSVSQIINVADDIPPVVTCPPAQVFCVVNNNTYTIPPVTASDNCSGTLNITYQITGATTRNGTGNNASGVFNVGVSTITWTVIDACGNTATCTTTVTINPKPVPIITHN